MFKKFTLSCFLVFALSAGCLLFAFEQEKPVKKLLLVGIYDSRAIAIACCSSEYHSNFLNEKKKELEAAKEKGDQKRIEELENWGRTHQARLHKQGFGAAPVHDLLKYIKDDIPKVAEEAGVDVIVSKWEIVYQDNTAEFVDIVD